MVNNTTNALMEMELQTLGESPVWQGTYLLLFDSFIYCLLFPFLIGWMDALNAGDGKVSSEKSLGRIPYALVPSLSLFILVAWTGG
jgi:hypothetical protein